MDIGKTFFHLYADDTLMTLQLLSSSSPIVLRNGLEQQLKELGSWFHKDKLSVYTSNTEVIFQTK